MRPTERPVPPCEAAAFASDAPALATDYSPAGGAGASSAPAYSTDHQEGVVVSLPSRVPSVVSVAWVWPTLKSLHLTHLIRRSHASRCLCSLTVQHGIAQRMI